MATGFLRLFAPWKVKRGQYKKYSNPEAIHHHDFPEGPFLDHRVGYRESVDSWPRGTVDNHGGLHSAGHL